MTTFSNISEMPRWFRGLVRRSLSPVFYRYFYLSDGGLSRRIKQLVGAPQQLSKETWNSIYGSGSWEQLHQLSEQAHYAVLLSYILYKRCLPSVLDIGCGDGILFKRLQAFGYAQYTGIDIADMAIAACPPSSDEHTVFKVADAELFVPAGTFDAIIFSESIYYFRDPLKTVSRYANHLKPGGILAISLHRHAQTEAIRRHLRAEFTVLDETTVSNTTGTWFCLLLQPRSACSDA